MMNQPEHTAGGSVPIRLSEFDPRRSVEVSAGLIFRDGQLLITQRPAGGHLAGLWEFPGGKREPGETFEDCLRRELQEELGVAVVVHDLLESLTHAYPEKTVHLLFYRCTLAHPEAQPKALDCQAVQWVTRAQLTNYAFPDADARLLERLQNPATPW